LSYLVPVRVLCVIMNSKMSLEDVYINLIYQGQYVTAILIVEEHYLL